MSEGGAARPAARWRAQYVDTMLEPLDEAVPALVQSGHLWAVVRGDGELRRLSVPGLRLGTDLSLAHGGRGIYFERIDLSPDTSLRGEERAISQGFYRLNLADFSLDRLPYTPTTLSLAKAYHRFGVSRDGTRALIGCSWWPGPPRASAGGARVPGPDGRDDTWGTTLTLIDTSGAATTQLPTLGGMLSVTYPDDGAIQWSPDGRLVAVSGCDGKPFKADQQVFIYDTDTGREVARVGGLVALCGSLSWSPDSTRLLLHRGPFPTIYHLATNVEHPIPAIRQMPEPPGSAQPRVIGFADDHRLYTTTVRGKVLTLSRTDPDTGVGQPLARWSGGDRPYPILAAMPPDYWDN